MGKELVPSNATMIVHIRKSGYVMLCGQSFSNLTVSPQWAEERGYKVCKTCSKKI